MPDILHFEVAIIFGDNSNFANYKFEQWINIRKIY